MGWAKPSVPRSQRGCWGQSCVAASRWWSAAASLSLGGFALSTMRRFLRSGHDPARERLKRDLFQFNKVRGSTALATPHRLGLGHSGGLHLHGVLPGRCRLMAPDPGNGVWLAGFPGRGQWDPQASGLRVPSLTGCVTSADHCASSSLSFPTCNIRLKHPTSSWGCEGG